MRADYEDLARAIAGATEGETDAVARMAIVAAVLHPADDRFDWTGFYRVRGDRMLKLGPFQGALACTAIPFDRGVCGAAARTGEVQVVADVHAFPGHIACAASTRSEIVLPVTGAGGRLLGVLDIDSDRPAAFDTADAEGLAAILAATFGETGDA